MISLDARKLAPRPVRLAAYAAAAAALLYICLAPPDQLPEQRPLWDKSEHALAWAALTGLGVFLSPTRPRAIAAFAFGFGVLVEVLQETLPFGRHGDLVDLVADTVGIALALAVWAVLARVLRR